MIITIANQKGGVSKTTTTAAIGQGLAHKGCKVLFIDLDPQGNLTYHLGANAETSPVIADVIFGNATTKAAIQTTIVKWQVIACKPFDLSTMPIQKAALSVVAHMYSKTNFHQNAHCCFCGL